MKTAYYTFYTREATAGTARASGGEDRLVRFLPASRPRRPIRRTDNVIDLARYLPAASEPPADEAAAEALPRSRAGLSREGLIRMEWLACAAMICLAAAACAALLL